MRRNICEQVQQLALVLLEGVAHAATAGPAAPALMADCAAALASISATLKAQISAGRWPFYAGQVEEISGLMLGLLRQIEAGENTKKPANELKNAIKTLKKALAKEDEVKLEVAFFPYNASMWDAMASVCAAAMADPACNVCVVALPYYTLGANGEKEALCCDAALLPPGLPLLPYESYSLAGHQPDIAYVHSIFDGYNKVSRVDEAYYTHNVKKHVSALVYLPYFMNGSTSTEELALGTGMSAVDVSIAQNAADKALYEKHARKGQEVWALGSPKMDAILAAEAEKPAMPEEWAAQARGRRLFLLNTSLSALTAHSGQFIVALRRVFDAFIGHESAALWWRPHPLSAATMAAMRPELLQEYEELQAYFVQNAVGIIDHTADGPRAIALCEGYIGEASSSFMYMFGVTGKPMFLLNYAETEHPAKEEQEALLHMDVLAGLLCDGENIWATTWQDNTLCRGVLGSGRLAPLCPLPKRTSAVWSNFSSMLVLRGRLYIASRAANEQFLCYDIEKNRMSEHKLPGEILAPTIGIMTMLAIGDEIYFVPFGARCLYCYNVGSGAGRVIPLNSLPNGQNPMGYVCFAALLRGDAIWISSAFCNVVLEYNVKTGEETLHYIGDEANRYIYMVEDGEGDIWLSQFRKQEENADTAGETLVKYGPAGGRVDEFSAFPKGFVATGSKLYTLAYHDGAVWAFPNESNMIIKVDTKTGEMAEFNTGLYKDLSHREDITKGLPLAVRFSCKVGESGVLAEVNTDNSLLQIDMASGRCQKARVFVQRDVGVQEMNRQFRFIHGHVYYHSQYMQVYNFIQGVESGEIAAKNKEQAAAYAKQVANGRGGCGQRVHQQALAFVRKGGG